MIRHRHQLVSFVVFIMLVSVGSFAQDQGQRVDESGKGFASEMATVNGTKLHSVRGGVGPAAVLIHGFPQDCFEYHAITRRLARSNSP